MFRDQQFIIILFQLLLGQSDSHVPGSSPLQTGICRNIIIKSDD